MKTALLGGMFDPPHLGHLWVAKQVLERVSDVLEVVLIPGNVHQWKKTVGTAKQRYEMTKFMETEKITVSDIEIKRGGTSYSIDTIKEYKKLHNTDVYWIVGSDILEEFSRWENSEDLVKEVKFIVFPRDPYHIPENIPPGFEVVKGENIITSNISSTAIRERVKSGLPISDFVTSEIGNYIKKNNLYK